MWNVADINITKETEIEAIIDELISLRKVVFAIKRKSNPLPLVANFFPLVTLVMSYLLVYTFIIPQKKIPYSSCNLPFAGLQLADYRWMSC